MKPIESVKHIETQMNKAFDFQDGRLKIIGIIKKPKPTNLKKVLHEVKKQNKEIRDSFRDDSEMMDFKIH